MEDWDQFKAVEDNSPTVWDRFASADEEEDVLSKGLLALRSQSNKPIQDRLVSEDVEATDTAKNHLLHQDSIASGLKTAAAAANNSYTARLDRDLQDFSKPQEAAPDSRVEAKKPETLGEWTRQAVGSYAQYLEEDVADYRKRRAEKPNQDRMGNLGDTISEIGESIPAGSPLAPVGLGLQALGKTEAGTGFARGYLGGVETAGAGIRGMGETMEREGGAAFMRKAGEVTQAAGEKLTSWGIPAAAALRGPAEAMKSLATGKGTEGPSVLKQLGAAVQKQAAYATAEIPKAKVNSLEEIGWNPERVGDYTMAKIGEGLGSSSIFFTGGAIGGLAGAGFSSFSLGTGEVRQELERAGITDPKLIDQYSYVAGSAIAVLDSIIPAKLMSTLSSGVKKELGKYAVAKIAKSTMQDAASEGVTEAIQEAISIAAVAEAKGDQAAIAAIRDLEARQKAGAVDPEQANERAAYGLLALEALSKDWKRVAEAGVAGALPGAVMGGTGALGQSGRDILSDDQTRARGGTTDAKEGSTEAKQESATETKQDKLAVPPEAQAAEQQAQQDKVSAESIRQWAVEQYGQTARVYQDADEFVVGVHRPDGSVDWKMVPKDVAESSAKAATAAATSVAPKQEAAPQPAEQVADAAKPQEKKAAQQEEVAPTPEAVSEPQQAASATTEPVQTAVAGTVTRKTSAAEARAGQETEVAPQEAADVAETATAAQETAKQSPELTEKAFYDILESTAPLNTKAIAKKLGISAEEVGALSAKAEKSGWLTRTEGGKLRRAHAKKRPSREDVEAIQAMAVAPSIIAGSPSAKTPKVSEKYADIKEAINEAALKMLPASVRVKMVDAIKIATKRATDQLLSARKGVTSERFPSAGTRTGVPGLPTSASKQAEMGTADVSESGAARGLSAKDERIIRQESAAVGPDGKIIAGRRSRKAGASGSSGQNDTIQPVGVTEEFTTIAGMPGFVTAIKVSKAEARSGVLAKLTYRFYDKDNAPTADNIEMFVGNPQAQFELTQHEDGAWEFGWSFLVPELRKKGIGTKVYAALEKDLGIRMSPSGTLTEDGYAFWKKRSPASVQWHVRTPLQPGMYSSPRNISEEFERIGRELDRLTNPKNTIASMTPAFRNEYIENYLNDRKKLLKLLIKMPAEAKAARDSMFALPTSRGMSAEAKASVLAKMEAWKDDEELSDEVNMLNWKEMFFDGVAKVTSQQSPRDLMRLSGIASSTEPLLFQIKDDFLRLRKKVNDSLLPTYDRYVISVVELVRFVHAGDVNSAYGKLAEAVSLANELMGETPTPLIKNVTQFVRAAANTLGVQPLFALPGFYSPSIRAAESLSQTKGTGEQFWKQITKTPGVKKDELDWMGLEEWLKDKKSVTKEELLTFMRANQIELENVVLSDRNAKYAEYAPPGGSNYREFLIRMSSLRYSDTPEISARIDAIDAEIAALEKSGQPDEIIDAERRALYREQNKLLSARLVPAYTSKHFKDQEIVHIRVEDREGENGEKLLNIIEVQSDLHQTARKYGYKNPLTPDERAEFESIQEELNKIGESYFSEYYQNFFDAFTSGNETATEFVKSVDETAGKIARWNELSDKKFRENVAPPSAPFKGDLWLELALKRVLQHAVENGYDAVSWLRSDQIAAVVGAEPEKLQLQYDQKIGKFLNRYTKKWGGEVRQGVIPSISSESTMRQFQDILDGFDSSLDEVIMEEIVDVNDTMTPEEQRAGLPAAREKIIDGLKKGIANMASGMDAYQAFGVSRRHAASRDLDAGLNFMIGHMFTSVGDATVEALTERMNEFSALADRKILEMTSVPDSINSAEDIKAYADAFRTPVLEYLNSAIDRMKNGEDFYSAFGVRPGYTARDYIPENVLPVIDDLIPTSVRPEKLGRNQYLRVTDAMRKSIAEGQPLAMRRGPGEAEALGQTNPYDQIISLGMRAIELEAAIKGKTTLDEALRVFRHEVFEFFNAFGDAIYKPGEWEILKRAARKNGWIETNHVRDAYEKLYKGNMPDAELESILLKEAIAEQSSEYIIERKAYPKGIEGLFARLKDFITRVSNFLQGMSFNTWEDVFQNLNKGEFKKRFEREFPEQSEAVQRESMQLPGSTQIPDAVTPRAKPGTEKPQMSLTEIRDAVVEMLGLEVRRGRLDEGLKRAATKSGGELLGQYDPSTDIVRVREMNNIEVIFHEAGHQHINQKFKDRLGAEFVTAIKANAAELESLDPSGQQIVSEGFADFFRRYLLNHKIAKVKAPNFYAEFERLVKTSNPGLLAAMQEIQKRVEEYQKAPSAGRVMSSVKSTVKSSTAKQVLEDIKKYGPYVAMKWAKDFRTYLQRVYHSRVSDTNWVHLWTIEVAKNAETNNKQLDFSFWKNAGKQAQQLNNAYSIGWADLTEGVHFIGSVRKGSVSFHDALTLAFGGEDRAQWSDEMLNAFGSYLAARRGRWLWLRFQPEASAQIQGTFTEPPQGQFKNGQWFVDASNNNTIRVWLNGRWEDELSHAPDKNSRADHEQTVASLEAEHPQFAEAAQLVYKFMRDWSLKEYQAGFLTDKAFSQRMQENDYVPWFRIMDKDGAYGPTNQKRKTPRNFRLHGSYRDFINPIESITRMVYEGNYNIKLNTMKRTMQEVAMASGVGYGHLAEPLNTTEARATKYNLFDALMSEAKKRGVTEVDAQSMLNAVIGHIGDNGSSTIFRRGDINERGDQIIYYLQKGEVKAFALADDDIGKGVFQFFQTLGDAPDFDSLVSWLAWPGKLMQIGITSHPRFQIWNLIRDQFQAPAMVPGYVPLISNAKTVVDNWYERSKDQGQPWNERLTANAGIMAGMNSAAQMEMRSNRDIKAMRKKGISLRPVKADFWLGTMNPFSHEFWRWTEWGESSTRQTIARIEFKHSKAELAKLYPGMPAEELEYIALEEAVFKSSNYVPYNRGGQKMSWLRQMIRFLNAGLQGMDRAFKVALLAEMDSGQWATPRAIKKGAKSLASLAMPWFKHCNNDPLTAAEKKALGRAFNYWSVILTIAVIQNLIRAMGDDDDDALKEELTDYQDTTYIHVSLPFTKDVVAFFPRGFDLVGITSNAISTAYDAQWKKDPTARSKFVDSALKMVIPAHSVAGADMYSGIFENYNRFTDRPVVSDYLKAGRIPEDQHSPWVDPVSLSIGKTLGVSPNEVSFLMSKIGTQYYNDLTKVAIAASPNREALHWWEYPLVSSFFRDPSKYSKSKEKFYDVVKEYTQFAGSYGDRIKSRHPMEVKRYLDGLDPEVRAYVIAREHLDPDQKHLHPLMRMQAISKATNSIMRDIVTDRLPPVGDKKKEGEYVILSPTEKRDAFDALRGIEMREMRRTLITLGTPGWAQKRDDLLPPDKYYEQLKTALPKVWDIYQERTHGGRGGRDPMVYDFKRMKKMWPDIRRRLLDQNLEAEIVASRGNIELKTFRSEAREAMSMAD